MAAFPRLREILGTARSQVWGSFWTSLHTFVNFRIFCQFAVCSFEFLDIQGASGTNCVEAGWALERTAHRYNSSSGKRGCAAKATTPEKRAMWWLCHLVEAACGATIEAVFGLPCMLDLRSSCDTAIMGTRSTTNVSVSASPLLQTKPSAFGEDFVSLCLLSLPAFHWFCRPGDWCRSFHHVACHVESFYTFLTLLDFHLFICWIFRSAEISKLWYGTWFGMSHWSKFSDMRQLSSFRRCVLEKDDFSAQSLLMKGRLWCHRVITVIWDLQWIVATSHDFTNWEVGEIPWSWHQCQGWATGEIRGAFTHRAPLVSMTNLDGLNSLNTFSYLSYPFLLNFIVHVCSRMFKVSN